MTQVTWPNLGSLESDLIRGRIGDDARLGRESRLGPLSDALDRERESDPYGQLR